MRALRFSACVCVGLLGFAAAGYAAPSETQPKTGQTGVQSPAPAESPQAGGTPGPQAGAPAPTISGANPAEKNDEKCWGYSKLCAAIAARTGGKDKKADETFAELRDERRLAQEAIDTENRVLNEAEYTILKHTNDLSSYSYDKEDEWPKESKAALGKAEKQKVDAGKALSWLKSHVSGVDSELSSALRIETNKDGFKKDTSFNFALLIGGVIAGFFVVTLWTNIAADIFKNQSGLQFITLFSLVIAIVLFGILEILEGRELAALLGAISGYVLGRVSAGEVQTALAVPGVTPPGGAVVKTPQA